MDEQFSHIEKEIKQRKKKFLSKRRRPTYLMPLSSLQLLPTNRKLHTKIAALFIVYEKLLIPNNSDFVKEIRCQILSVIAQTKISGLD